MDRFKFSVDFVLEREGGLKDDPEDSGGVTNFGISLRFLKGPVPYATASTIKYLERETAVEFYQEQFWAPCKCSALPYGIDLAVFDCAVNQGPKTARKLLQRSLGVKDDGWIGPVTLAALLNADPVDVLDDFLARRAKRYAAHPKFDLFGRGWYRRLFKVHRAAM